MAVLALPRSEGAARAIEPVLTAIMHDKVAAWNRRQLATDQEDRPGGARRGCNG